MRNQKMLFAAIVSASRTTFVFAQPSWQPDLNGDSFVDLTDFTILAENWRKSGSGLGSDFDNSGTVDDKDLARFAEKWLQRFVIVYVDANAAPGGDGGGMYNCESDSQVINCLFNNNHADSIGGALYNSYKAVKLTNCTIACNSATGDASSGIYNTHSSSTITSCIVWDNGEAIYNKSCNPHIFYCDIKDCGGSGSNWDPNYSTDDGNNIDSDPCFINANNPAGLDGIFATADDGLALDTSSPCINAGNDSALPPEITADIKGDARFNEPVDIGAYEFGEP